MAEPARPNMTRRCANHPRREAPWFCFKHSVAYCDECCRCPHPEGHCQFRSQCVIWHVCLASAGVDAASQSPGKAP